MGLFSPRKESRGLARSASDDPIGSNVKSKWYTLSRNSKHPTDNDGPAHHENGSDVFVDQSQPRQQRLSIGSLPAGGTDRTTTTLAQRLNELAVSHADGLLGDDDYRLLRQNLLERFGAANQTPTEAPTVRLSAPQSMPASSPPPSSFHVDPNFRVSGYAASMRSNTSRTSTVTAAIKGVVRRVSGRPPSSLGSDIYSDDTSISNQSITSSIIYRPSGKNLAHQPSNISIHSSFSNHQQMDSRSVSSQKTGRSARTNRTSASRGPPSAYNRRRVPQSETGDESSAELRAEIVAVELEKKQLLQNFEGLELSIMAPNGPASRSRSSSTLANRPSSLWTVTPDNHHTHPSTPPQPPPPPIPSTGPSLAERKRLLGLNESQSTATTRKSPHSSISNVKVYVDSSVPSATLPPPSSSSSSKPPSTPVKSSLFNRKRPIPASEPRPRRSATDPSHPPTLPAHFQPQSKTLSSSSSSSSLGLDTIPHDPDVQRIQERKRETMDKYDQRLEYLRARLKGAELRERLI